MIINTDNMSPMEFALYLVAKDNNDTYMLQFLEEVESLRQERDEAVGTAEKLQSEIDEAYNDLAGVKSELELAETTIENMEERIQELEQEVEAWQAAEGQP